MCYCEAESIFNLLHSGKLSKMSSYDLYELRVHIKHNIFRILCAVHGSALWLLHVFQKKSQKIKQREIETALERLKELKLTGEYSHGL